MSQATLELIPGYSQVVVDDTANTLTIQWYDTTTAAYVDVATFGLAAGTSFSANNGANTLTGTVSITGTATASAGLIIPGTGGAHSATIDLTGNGTAAPYFDNDGNLHFPNAESGYNWNFNDVNSNKVLNVFTDGTKKITTAINTVDDGSGNSANNPATTSLAGTTAGSIIWVQPQRGTRKVFTAVASGYENNSTTNQTITFPVAFTNAPAIAINTTGLTLTASTTTLTITAPNATTLFNGVIEVVGI